MNKLIDELELFKGIEAYPWNDRVRFGAEDVQDTLPILHLFTENNIAVVAMVIDQRLWFVPLTKGFDHIATMLARLRIKDELTERLLCYQDSVRAA